ncbi:tripartite motif-containing protein 75 [Hoplias malabaricus]|uniref:tripartite motif-containing protein 75 n=1 Tax=Hoplias malabaricus TaxID=27720 RepID=UPI0034631E4E
MEGLAKRGLPKEHAMADFSESSLELELSCPICLHLFLDPVTLHCGHSFCLTCLEENRISEGCGSDVLHHCPECRVEYKEAEFQQRNQKLRNIVRSYKDTIEQTARETPQREDVQMIHYNDEHIGNSQVKYGLKNSEKETAKCPLSESAGCILSEPSENRFRLTPVITNLQAKIALVDELLAKAKDREAAVKASNTEIRAEVKTLMDEMSALLNSYSTAGMELLEAELKPREEAVENIVKKVSDFHKQLKETELHVTTLLEEQDNDKISVEIQNIEASVANLIAEPLEIELSDAETNPNMSNMCVEMEYHNSQLRLELGAVQRQLRAILNPSEVTFDSETLHPNLVLSEDHKTVSFSVSKQPYLAGPKRFTSFLQSLSSQSFSKGEHCWCLQAEGCSWVIGLCYGGLTRSGPGSGLESSNGSWCLMWCDNLLRAYEGGKDTTLMRTPFLQKLEICLSFNSSTVAFYSISNVSGAKTHIYTFRVSFTEPVYLGVRMMSGKPKAQITLCE